MSFRRKRKCIQLKSKLSHNTTQLKRTREEREKNEGEEEEDIGEEKKKEKRKTIRKS